MKRFIKIVIWSFILTLIFVSYLYLPIETWFGLTRETIWYQFLSPIIVNIIVYIVRTILLGFFKRRFKGKIIQFTSSIVINLIWVGFIMWLLFSLAPDYALAISSFLIVAISLTFRNRINNIVSGIMIILTEGFEVGDLIETNGIEGIVEDISLNYTQIRQFNGIIALLPNQIVFNAKVKKFTYRTLKPKERKIDEKETNFIERYGDKFFSLLAKGNKIARYVKVIEVRPNIDPKSLEYLLKTVFDKYELLLGFKPIFYVNQTTFNRCSITLQLISESTKKLIIYANPFLKDILYRLYYDEVFEGWEGELPSDLVNEDNKRGGM